MEQPLSPCRRATQLIATQCCVCFLGPTCSGDVERTLMKEQCVVLRVAVSEPVSSAGRFLTDTESSEARKEHRSWRERDGAKELAPIEIIKSRRAV